MSFDTGMQLGMRAFQEGAASARQDRIRKEDVDYRRQRDQLSDARTAMADRLDTEKFGMLKTEFDLKQKLAKQDMEDFATARSGLDSFQTEYRSIAADDPERVSKVTALKLKYLPSIARNKSVAGQFQALDTAEKQTAAWVNDSILKDQMAATLTEAARLNLGPEALGIMKATQSGQMTIMEGLSQLQSAMSASRKDLADQAMDREIKVRRAPYEARAESMPTRMGEVEKAQMGSDVRQLDALQKEMRALQGVDPAANPQAAEKLRLLQGSALRLQRKIQGYKAPVAQPAQAETMPGRLPADDPLGLFGD